MMQDKFIRFDWASKRLLRDRANFGVLEGFLTVFIGEKIKIVEIPASQSSQAYENDHSNRVDITARNSEGEIIIVEVQIPSDLYYPEHLPCAPIRTIAEQMLVDGKYVHVKKAYFISILYFFMGKGADYIYRGQNPFTGVRIKDQLGVNPRERDAIMRKVPAGVTPEYIVLRIDEFDEEVTVTPFDEWIRYLKTGEICPYTQVPGLQEAHQKLVSFRLSPIELRTYIKYLEICDIQNEVIDAAKWDALVEGQAVGLKMGIDRGLDRGQKNAQLLIASRMREQGISADLIRICTGLTDF